MPPIEDRSRPSSMAVASRCTTAPIAAVPARGVPEVGVSCCAVVLVDQPTKDVAATELAYVRRTPCLTAL